VRFGQKMTKTENLKQSQPLRQTVAFNPKQSNTSVKSVPSVSSAIQEKSIPTSQNAFHEETGNFYWSSLLRPTADNSLNNKRERPDSTQTRPVKSRENVTRKG
jgi:hypothetical protein